jgi:hypothetical protein
MNSNDFSKEVIMEPEMNWDRPEAAMGQIENDPPVNEGNKLQGTTNKLSYHEGDKQENTMPSNLECNFFPSEKIKEPVSECESYTSSQDIANEEDNNKAVTIGKNESQNIYRFKVGFLLIILSVAIASSSCVFIFIKKS